jgi:hypothetical protein
MLRCHPRRGGPRVRGPPGDPRAHPHGPARARALPLRGRTRRRQDHPHQGRRHGHRRARSSASSSPPTSCRATSPGPTCCRTARADSPSPRGPSSPTWCSATRSTAPRPRPRARCSRRCRSARSPSTARRTRWPALLRARDAEPHRAGGHLPPARGAGRPLSAAHRGALPHRRGRDPRPAHLRRRSRPSARPVLALGEVLWLQSVADSSTSTTRCTPTPWPSRSTPATHPRIALGASPRASLGIVLAARAPALLAGRGFVIPDDVKRVCRT